MMVFTTGVRSGHPLGFLYKRNIKFSEGPLPHAITCINALYLPLNHSTEDDFLDMDKCSHASLTLKLIYVAGILFSGPHIQIYHLSPHYGHCTFTCIMVYNNYYSWVYRISCMCMCTHDTYIATLYNCGNQSLSVYQLFDNHLIWLVG